MVNILERIVDILEPIKDSDWHGKWRIQNVLELCRLCSNKHLNNQTIDYHTTDGRPCKFTFPPVHEAKIVDGILQILATKQSGDWKEWRGGDRPYSPETIIQIKWSDGDIEETTAGNVAWSTLGRSGSIHYRTKTSD